MSPSLRIAIIGGGPTGLACALLLASRGFAPQVFDARTLPEAQRDARLLALSRGSWITLAPLLGPHLPHRAEIRDVYVSSAGEFGVTHLPSRDGIALGATVHYGDLLTALAAAADTAGIDIRRPMKIDAITQTANSASLRFADDTSLDADLVIVAEGTPHETYAPQSKTWALLAPLLMSTSPGAAFERFTREGPLALLPAPAPTAAEQSMALVWCMSEETAQRRALLDDALFVGELQEAIGPRIGKVLAVGQRCRFPLMQAANATPVEHRIVRVGNAAQTLHPVAGQGFNLGLRDCVVMADAITPAQTIDAALTQFAARRSTDRRAISAITASLPAVFASRFAPLALARTAGLNVLNLVPPLRDALAHLLMFGVRA